MTAPARCGGRFVIRRDGVASPFLFIGARDCHGNYQWVEHLTEASVFGIKGGFPPCAAVPERVRWDRGSLVTRPRKSRILSKGRRRLRRKRLLIRFEGYAGNYYYLSQSPHGFSWVSDPSRATVYTRHKARKALTRLFAGLLSVIPEIVRQKH